MPTNGTAENDHFKSWRANAEERESGQNVDRQHDPALRAQTVTDSTIHQITLNPFTSVCEEESFSTDCLDTCKHFAVFQDERFGIS